MIRKPSRTPRLNGKDFLNPYLLALVMDMMLLGPGVKAVKNMYEKNAVKFIKICTSFQESVIMDKTYKISNVLYIIQNVHYNVNGWGEINGKY